MAILDATELKRRAILFGGPLIIEIRVGDRSVVLRSTEGIIADLTKVDCSNSMISLSDLRQRCPPLRLRVTLGRFDAAG